MNWSKAVAQSEDMLTVARAIVAGALDGVVPSVNDAVKSNFERIVTSEGSVMVEAGDALLSLQTKRILKAQRLYQLHDFIHTHAKSIVEEAQTITNVEVDFDYYAEPAELTSDFMRAEEGGYIENLEADAFEMGSLESNVEYLGETIEQYSALIRSINEILDSEHRAGDQYVRLRRDFVAQYNEAWRKLVASVSR